MENSAWFNKTLNLDFLSLAHESFMQYTQSRSLSLGVAAIEVVEEQCKIIIVQCSLI